MPKKASTPSITWDTTSHINISIKVNSPHEDDNAAAAATEEENGSSSLVTLKLSLSQQVATDDTAQKITNWHQLFLRLMSNQEKAPKKATYSPTYQNSSIFRVTNNWLVGGDLFEECSGKNGQATLDYTDEQLKVTQEQLDAQDLPRRGSIILPNRNQYEFGSIFAIVLNSEGVKHLRGDVLVMGQLELEALDELEEILRQQSYLVSLDQSALTEGEDDTELNPEIQILEKGSIVVESCEVVLQEEKNDS